MPLKCLRVHIPQRARSEYIFPAGDGINMRTAHWVRRFRALVMQRLTPRFCPQLPPARRQGAKPIFGLGRNGWYGR